MLYEGKFPFEKPGTHRRVRLAGVVEYKEVRKAEQHSALHALSPADDSTPESSNDDMKLARMIAAKRRLAAKA